MADIFHPEKPAWANCDFKKIEGTVGKPLNDEMHGRLQTPKGQEDEKLRQATVKPVIGTLVAF